MTIHINSSKSNRHSRSPTIWPSCWRIVNNWPHCQMFSPISKGSWMKVSWSEWWNFVSHWMCGFFKLFCEREKISWKLRKTEGKKLRKTSHCVWKESVECQKPRKKKLISFCFLFSSSALENDGGRSYQGSEKLKNCSQAFSILFPSKNK